MKQICLHPIPLWLTIRTSYPNESTFKINLPVFVCIFFQHLIRLMENSAEQCKQATRPSSAHARSSLCLNKYRASLPRIYGPLSQNTFYNCCFPYREDNSCASSRT